MPSVERAGAGRKCRQDLKARTRTFALDTIRYCLRLPQRGEYRIISRQLMRSATSVGANYRSASRARSRADFIAKLALVEEEADESLYWFELLADLGASGGDELRRLSAEAGELVAIAVTSRKTARSG